MKRFANNRISLPIILCLAAVFLAVPHFAHAGVFDILATPVDLVTKILSITMEVIILPLAAGIMYLSGLLFDSSVYFGLHTAYLFSLSPAINLGWVIIRDIANIFFIFILIWISLGTIVEGLRFGTANMLKSVIIAAILINFSLFITKAAIDVSNVFGNWLYGGIQKTLSVNTTGCDPTGSVVCADHTSLSGLIATRLGIIGFWGATANTSAATAGQNLVDPSKGIINSVIRLIVVLVTTYIFAYAAILFIARSIELLFLLVFSPIGFMGKVLPAIDDFAKEWRHELMNAAIFPVAFLLMLYISLQFINSIDSITPAMGGFNVQVGVNLGTGLGNNNVSSYFQFFLIIFLLHSTLKVAKKYSGEMGEKLEGLAKGLAETAVGVAGGGAALLGKIAVGGAASRMANSNWLNQRIAGGGVLGAVAGSAQGGLGKVADYHFDPRAGAGLGIKPGKGYKSMMDDRSKRQEKATEDLAAKRFELKDAKDELKEAERNAYAAHPEYGHGYGEAANQINTHDDAIAEYRRQRADMVRAGQNTEDIDRAIDAQIRDRDEIKRKQNKIKAAIEADEDFKLSDEIHNQRKDILGNMKAGMRAAEQADDQALAAEYAKKIASLEAAMRQGNALEAAKKGAGISIATNAAKAFSVEKSTTRKGKLAKILMGVATGGTTTILGAAGEEYLKKNDQTVKKMGEAMKKGNKKKQAADITKIISEMAEEGGGPAGGAPAAGGGPAGGGGPAVP